MADERESMAEERGSKDTEEPPRRERVRVGFDVLIVNGRPIGVEPIGWPPDEFFALGVMGMGQKALDYAFQEMKKKILEEQKKRRVIVPGVDVPRDVLTRKA